MSCPTCGDATRPDRLFCGRCGTRLARACGACGSPNEPGQRFCGRCGAAFDAADGSGAGLPAALADGRYEVRRLLGEGGKKRVYLASDTRLERDVAIALVKTEGLDEAGLARVRREARAMGRLGDHPHIVTVFDVGEEDARPFIVSQYMPGGSVDDLLRSAPEHRLPIEQTLRIASELCGALEHAHECGIVHRDVKPSNVWLTADGTAKLGDFGLAIARDRSRLTADGMMVGTAAYMAPEQALGHTPAPRTDLYALGAMIYEMLTGRPPFLGDDAIGIVSQHLHTAPVAPSWHNGAVPKALEALVLQLLAKDPEDRPASAAAVRAALATISSRAATVVPASAQANPLDRLAGGVFVGREQEIEALRRAVDEARAGRGQLVLLAGEPGIGKTRVATELGTYARVRGFQVLWGRSHETGGAPAYWPWVQIIRAYLHDRDAQSVRAEMGTGAADIAQVVSEVRERLPDLPLPPALEPEQARFRLFDGIATFLRNATRAHPLVLVLDDVHWADQASLLLLQFLAREMGPSRLLVICTYRDIELGRDHPLFQSLGDLTREPVTTRFTLRGLTPDDVARYIEMTAGAAVSAEFVATVHGETEGNPFFLGEVVRLLVAEGRFGAAGQTPGAKLAVPQSVREVIGRRLQRLSPECNQMLRLASAVGREFGLEALQPITGSSTEDLLEWLDEAIGARIVTKVLDAVGRHRFAHALVREALYEEVSPARRIRLHRQIGEGLETLHGARPEPYVAELAYHFAQAAEDGRGVDKAIDYARRAGERALAQLAYEEGARHYQAAVDLLAAHRPGEDAERVELLLGLGAARRRTGEIDRATVAIREAADAARRLGAAELLARAALAYGGQGFAFGVSDDYEVALLEDALAALGRGDSALRARLAARLAMGLYASPARDRSDALSEDAVAMARRLGDPAVLAHALHSRHAVLWGPRHLDDRLAIATEIVRLADAAGDKEQLAHGRHFRIVDLLEQGDVRAAYRDMDAQSRLADELRQPLFEWHRMLYRAMRAFLEGRTDEGEQLANETLMLGQRASPDAFDTYGVQLFAARRDQGRLDELEAAVAASVEQQPHVPAWRAALAYLYAEIGREDEARREIEAAADGLATLPEDAVWMPSLALLSNACAIVRDAARAATLYDLLLPYASRAVIVGAGVACAGAMSYYLGLLAATTGRTVEACLHFETALAMNERLGGRTWLAQTRLAYARVLRARGDARDEAKAATLLAQALEAAQELGMKRLVERILVETSPTGGPDGATADGSAPRRGGASGRSGTSDGGALPGRAADGARIFRREGDYWTLAFDGTVCRLRDSKGLRHIAQLLVHPGEHFDARELAGESVPLPAPTARLAAAEVGADGLGLVVAGLGDAGAVLDATAKAAYRRRVEELREDLEEAERFNDSGRAASAREELDFIAGQLSAAVGLGGRDRKAASTNERARLTVTKRIKDALGRIRDRHPALGRYLAAHIKTGYLCAYTPPIGSSISWES